jgi:hypothetical protein
LFSTSAAGAQIQSESITEPQVSVVQDVEHQPRLGAEGSACAIRRHVLLSPRHPATALARGFRLDEAVTFGIESGITVPIRGGFGRVAAFTLATDESAVLSDRLLKETRDVIQLVGLYFHTHVTTKLGSAPLSAVAAVPAP